jgi:hypothetical protein
MQQAVEIAPVVCACCGQPGTRGTSWVVVWARMCGACGTTGNVITSPTSCGLGLRSSYQRPVAFSL